MNFTCSICAELFRNGDAQNLHVTRCGHVFHNVCLSKWLEMKTTCPECRSKTTHGTVIRLYVNTADNSYADINSEAPDLTNLQSENDNLKFQLLEKSGIINKSNETIKQLEKENTKLTSGQTQSRSIILMLEQKVEQNKIISREHTDQIQLLKSRLSEIDKLRDSLKEANEKIRVMDVMQQLISGTQKETEELLREGRTITELATTVTALRRELRTSNIKRAQIRANVEELSKELRKCKDEKLKMEEKYSILESKVFQLENGAGKDTQFDSRENSIDENKSPATDKPIDGMDFGERLAKRAIRTGTLKSPSLSIKASSIAGLSPLLKRSASSESYKLSPIADDKPEKYSILKKPRLVHNTTKKSELRPSRLVAQNSTAPSTSTSTHSTTKDEQNNCTKPSIGYSFQNFGNKTANLNNKFRFGAVSKPNN